MQRAGEYSAEERLAAEALVELSQRSIVVNDENAFATANEDVQMPSGEQIARPTSNDERLAAEALIELSQRAVVFDDQTAAALSLEDVEGLDRDASPINDDDIAAAHALLQLSRDTRDVLDDETAPVTAAEVVQDPPREASPLNDDDIAAANALLQLSRDTLQPSAQPLAQQQEREAIWTLRSFGETEFFNTRITRDFSQEEIVAMRNRGEITEDDFFGAFSANPQGAPGLREFLDPNRPRVIASTNLFPPINRRSNRLRNTGKDVTKEGAEQAAEQAAERALKRAAIKPENQAAKQSTQRATEHSTDEGDSNDADSEMKDDARAQETVRVRAPLKPRAGPPRWDYLRTSTKDDTGLVEHHIYQPKSGKKVTAQDFQDPDFCRDVNRWFRQIHRRKGATNIRRQSPWSSKEKSVFQELLKNRGDQTWSQIAREFNERMNLHGEHCRTASAMRSLVTKNKSLKAADNPKINLKLNMPKPEATQKVAEDENPDADVEDEAEEEEKQPTRKRQRR